MALDQVTPRWPDIEGLRARAGELLLATEEVEDGRAGRKAFADWSGCMKASGYDYPDPWSMADDFPAELLNEAEKALAVASAGCMHSSGLLRTWSEARAKATWEEMQRSCPDLLQRWEALLAETVAHVEDLSEHGS
jgi:hypothetical protein